MFARRAAFAVLFLLAMTGSLVLAALALAPGGLGFFDIVALILFALTLPWMVAGFCNALIGFVIMRYAADPVAAVLPAVGRIRDDDPVTASTAILLCVRNELPVRTVRNLEPMLDGLCASGYAERFHLYLLSDTSDAALAVAEEALFSELIATWRDRIAISYRRRTVNSGFKAGNIREFCERWGSRHEFAVTLDADSFMPADAIVRLVRIMQVDPKLGILQGLIVGLPSTSLFARIFQFNSCLTPPRFDSVLIRRVAIHSTIIVALDPITRIVPRDSPRAFRHIHDHRSERRPKEPHRMLPTLLINDINTVVCLPKTKRKPREQAYEVKILINKWNSAHHRKPPAPNYEFWDLKTAGWYIRL